MPRAPKMPGALPSEQPTAQTADDLAEFADGEKLPAFDPVQAQLAEMQAEISRLKRRGQPEAAKPNTREPEMSEEEAMAKLAEDVSNGIRPRAILTPSGWMTHREMSRSPASVGNKG